mmetsp:Transcript_1227/g.4490  ORF Transcript_1227/g.4490 Transcript_1227/m.4490 type:complete len:202 (-) Transcript_1227:152-757(-)
MYIMNASAVDACSLPDDVGSEAPRTPTYPCCRRTRAHTPRSSASNCSSLNTNLSKCPSAQAEPARYQPATSATRAPKTKKNNATTAGSFRALIVTESDNNTSTFIAARRHCRVPITATAITTPEPEIAVGDNALGTKGATTSDVASAQTFAAMTASTPSATQRKDPCCVSNAAIARMARMTTMAHPKTPSTYAHADARRQS